MRVLATVTGSPSHTRSLVIALRPLIEAGDDVTIAAPPDLAPLVGNLGATVHAVLPDMLTLLSSNDHQVLRDTASSPSHAANMFTASPVWLDAAKAVAELANTVRPDLIVRDDAEIGAVLAGELLGIPHVSLSGGASILMDPAVAIDGLNRHWAALGQRQPLGPEAFYRHGRIDYVPAAFDFSLHDSGLVHRYRQPVLTRPGERLPAWIADRPVHTPFIYASLGTALPVVVEESPVPLVTDPVRALAAIIAAVAEMDCVAMISTGSLPVPDRPLPAHVHLVEHAPQPLVLEVADLFITHAGYNGIREALRSATPMLAIPGMGDQPHNAERVARLGLGEMTTEPTPATITRLAHRILDNPEYVRRAGQARVHTLSLPEVTRLPEDMAAIANQLATA